jgi:hypothetical protein
MSEKIMRAHKPYEKPEVTTYDRNELVADTVFTQNQDRSGGVIIGDGEITNTSDRNLKKNVRRMDSRRVLALFTRRG